MKKYNFDRTLTGQNPKPKFWMSGSFGKWLGKLILFLLMLVAFILLFAIPRCSPGRILPPIAIGEDTTVVTDRGDTLVGKHPELFDPSNPRDNNNGNNPDRSRNAAPVDWPKQIGDGRNPALPPKNDNRIPPTDPGNVYPDPNSGRQLDGAHLLVVLNSDSGDETFNKFAQELSTLYDQATCGIDYYNTLTKLVILTVDPAQRESIKSNLPGQIQDIDFYVCDIEVFASNSVRPSDPAFNYPAYSWQYEPIQAYEAWDITMGSRNVNVAVVDSYFDLDHIDLCGVNVIAPMSIENGTTDVYPKSGVDEGSFVHGTHVAGLVLAQMNNREGSCGIAPNCSFIPVSLGSSINTASLVEGILYAVYQGADVINASIGIALNPDVANSLSLPEQAEIARTEDIPQEMLWDYIFKLCDERNVTIVWAAGNSNILSAIDNSKRGENTVRVDAVDENLCKARFSNFGNVPEYGFDNSTVSAPGCSILSTIPYSDYYPLDGTSMAAPIVTGAVALMKSICPTISNADVIRILKTTAKPLNDTSIGGLLQIRSALDEIVDEFLRYEDVMNNHSLLIGKWESTENLTVSGSDGEPTGEKIVAVFEFTSENAGRIDMEYRIGRRTGEVCSSALSVRYYSDRIVISEATAPVSEQGSTFMEATMTCTPDESGLLKVLYKQSDNSKVEFYLRKI